MLQKMTAVQYTKNAAGMVTGDIIVPKGVPAEIEKMSNSWKHNVSQVLLNKRGTAEYTQALDMLKMRIGLFNQSIDSAAHKMINWGKNTQWAGRQLTVGLAVPLAAFAALSAKAAYDVNKQLTRIIKVYDFSSRGAQQQADAQALSNDSFKNGVMVAKMYGSALTDTLDVEAQLAATGQKGMELLRATNEVQRASILGEMDKQDTVKATIALQAMLHHSSSQLADDFNYMNAVENATNLTMQDFVTAIPRALGPLSTLGVSLQDMGVLLATMKSRGIEAAQGANALKSGLNRVLNPTKAVREQLGGLGIDIVQIVNQSGGNFMKIMIALSDQMARLKLSTLDQQRIIGKLFGTFQSSRTTAIIMGLQDIHDKTTQVGRAFQTAQQSTQQWGIIATQEMNRVQQSAAGKFRKAIESIKAQFSDPNGPGATFLHFATMVVHIFTGLIKFFNGLPSKFKLFMIGALITTALVGPIIMLVGLFGNLVGQGLNLFHTILSLGNGFKAMTAQERAAQMLAEQHTYVWENEAKSAQALAGSIAQLTEQFSLLAYEQQAMRMGTSLPGKMLAGNVMAPGLIKYTDKSGADAFMRPGGKFASQAEIDAYKAAEIESNKIVGETVVTERNWGKVATHAATFASVASLGMMAMTSGTNHVLNTIINMVFVGGLIGPAIVRGLKSAGVFFIIGNMLKSIGASIMGSTLVSGLKTALVGAGDGLGAGLLKSLGKALPYIGVAALAVGGVWYMIHRKMMENKKNQEEINSSTQSWANILNFVYEDYKKISTTSKLKNQDQILVLAGQLAKARPAFANYIQDLKNAGKQQDVLNAAIYEGLKARQHGATAAEASNVVQITLALAGFRGNDLNELIKQAMSQVNFADSASVQENMSTQMSNLFKKIATGALPDAKSAAQGLGKEFFNSFTTMTPEQKMAAFSNLKGTIDQMQKRFMASLGAGFAEKTPEDALSLLEKSGARGAGTLISRIQNFIALETSLTQAIATQSGVSSDNIGNFKHLGDLMGQLSIPTMTATNAFTAYNNAVGQATNHGMSMDRATQLNVLNYYRLKAGLSAATSVEQGFGDVIDATTGKLLNNSQAVKKNILTSDDFVNATKTAMQGAQQAAVSAADTIWNYSTQNQQAAMQTQTDNQDKAFDRQETRLERHFRLLKNAVSKEFQVRINAVNKEINAEQNAETIRQKIFDAEQERLSRLAQAANDAIDFNVAVNTGSLDEAAKIFNSMQAGQDDNAIKDAQASDSDASQKRIDSLQKELKHVEKLRDARLKALDRELNAEKNALARRKKLFDDEAAAKQQMMQRELDMRKSYLDLEISAVTASVPRTKAEYEKQVSQIESVYQKYGVNLQGYGKAWGQYVGAALSENVKAAANGLRDQINWTKIAHKIAGQFTDGAFGLTINQFSKWIMTGKLPKSGLHPDAGTTSIHDTGGNSSSGTPLHGGAHSGGIIGQTGPRNLAGRSPSSGLYRDEVMVRAQHGEYMINRNAHKQLGTGFLDSINAVGRHSGGAIGIGALPYMMLSGLLSGAVGAAINKAGAAKMGSTGVGMNFLKGVPNVGSFKGITDDALRNAAIIVAVGRKMGATMKDEITALTVALVESGLHNLNYGDRDSLGLFQQRPSQGWGTPAQIMNPQYSSHAFYASLMRYPQRTRWPIGESAQVVQRSAYPDIYYGMVPKARSVYQAIMPSLSGGGNIRYDNTIANLHRRETVLTAPLSDSLKRGIRNLETNTHDYTVTIDMRGAIIDSDVDIEKAVNKALDKRESKHGRNRHIGGDK